MQAFPHRYHASADALPDGDVALASPGLTTMATASPIEFDGPGGRWSPEALLTGAVADCFILTFRSVARAMKLPWTSIHCEVAGTLDRVERVIQFTGFDLTADLEVPPGADGDVARLALQKAERSCLISNSLKGTVHLHPRIAFGTLEPVAA